MANRLIIMAAVAAFALSSLPARGEEHERPQPNASFGVAGSVSFWNGWETKGGDAHTRTFFAPGYSGGFVFEKMFNNHFGIQSGLWANSFTVRMSLRPPLNTLAFDPTSMVSTRLTVNGWSLSFPLSFLASINASFFSFNILCGIKYTHAITSQIRTGNPLVIYRKRLDMIPYIGQPQVSFTAGLIFRFRVSRYIDLFAGGTAELFATEMHGGDTGIIHLFNLGAVSGVMFRTNLFPMTVQ